MTVLRMSMVKVFNMSHVSALAVSFLEISHFAYSCEFKNVRLLSKGLLFYVSIIFFLLTATYIRPHSNVDIGDVSYSLRVVDFLLILSNHWGIKYSSR